ncbi:MAG: MTAP family purine nucleoside phosphorylase [Opitutae bacterium]|nr:MTAP family purine nucleoside phosphorylase [Opitutae bacterium]
MIGYLVGSGFYEQPGFTAQDVATRFGRVTVLLGRRGESPVALISRHGPGHARLSHQVDYRANLLALKKLGARAVVSCSVCGVLRPDWPLGHPLLASEVFFPSNRLPDGSLCSVFTEPAELGRGHLIAGSLVEPTLTAAIERIWRREGLAPLTGTYGHVDGPRLNTKSEVRALRAAGVDFISQTCGPESVLANELELPYALAAFGVDHANGVTDVPTPPETLKANLTRATAAFRLLLRELAEPAEGFRFSNFVYRFD